MVDSVNGVGGWVLVKEMASEAAKLGSGSGIVMVLLQAFVGFRV